jgi:hypothetical protein
MRRMIGLYAIAALLAFPAAADTPFAPPTAPLNPDAVKPGAKPIAQTFSLNGVNGTLEKTTFAQVQKRFGGQLKRQGDAGGSLAWLCYDLPEKHLRVWLSAGELHIQNGIIDQATVWSVSSPANSADCPVAAGRQSAELDGVSPGQPLAVAQARLGTPGAARDGWAAYAYRGKAGAFDRQDYLVMKVDNGTVTHLQASRTSTN